MKIFFQFFTMMLIVSSVSAQSNSWNSGNENPLNDKEFLLQSHSTQSQLRELAYVPINERDSAFSNVDLEWYYLADATHQYYSDNCKDSLITYTVNGGNKSRTFIEWDSTSFYYTHRLFQSWNGSSWVDSVEYQSPVQYGCYIDYEIDRTWNGASWDTTLGIWEKLSFDDYGRIEERHYYMYVNSEWITYRRVYPHYTGATDTISGIDDFHYSTTTGQLISGHRDTSYVWLIFSSFCNSFASEYLLQSYDIDNGTWKNDSKFIQTIEIEDSDTLYNTLRLAWNASYYDSSTRSYTKYDIHGNQVENVDQLYDAANETWLPADTIFKYLYSYGVNGEVLRVEYFDVFCSTDYYQLYPCSITNFSDFLTCDIAGSVNSPNFQNSDLILFPSPVEDILFVKLNSISNGSKLQIYNLEGRQFQCNYSQTNNQTFQINTAELPTGFYFIDVVNDESPKRWIGKFVKE